MDSCLIYEKKYIELTEEDRAKVTGVYHAWQQEGYEETYQNVPEFCYSASFDEVAEKGFIPILVMILLVGILQIVLSCVLSNNLKRETLVERIQYQG